jgi:hypothetical protein
MDAISFLGLVGPVAGRLRLMHLRAGTQSPERPKSRRSSLSCNGRHLQYTICQSYTQFSTKFVLVGLLGCRF